MADANPPFSVRLSGAVTLWEEGRLMSLSVDEFLRRFLLHLLPPRFVRIRYCGFLANLHG